MPSIQCTRHEYAALFRGSLSYLEIWAIEVFCAFQFIFLRVHSNLFSKTHRNRFDFALKNINNFSNPK